MNQHEWQQCIHYELICHSIQQYKYRILNGDYNFDEWNRKFAVSHTERKSRRKDKHGLELRKNSFFEKSGAKEVHSEIITHKRNANAHSPHDDVRNTFTKPESANLSKALQIEPGTANIVKLFREFVPVTKEEDWLLVDQFLPPTTHVNFPKQMDEEDEKYTIYIVSDFRSRDSALDPFHRFLLLYLYNKVYLVNGLDYFFSMAKEAAGQNCFDWKNDGNIVGSCIDRRKFQWIHSHLQNRSLEISHVNSSNLSVNIGWNEYPIQEFISIDNGYDPREIPKKKQAGIQRAMRLKFKKLLCLLHRHLYYIQINNYWSTNNTPKFEFHEKYAENTLPQILKNISTSNHVYIR